MKNLFLFSITCIFIFCNCSNDSDSDSSANPAGLNWRYVLDSIDSDLGAPIWDPIIYEDIVIIPKVKWKGEKGQLIALNKFDGKILWTWSEAFDKYDKAGFSVRSYAYDGILAIADNNYSAGININTGETIWENLGNVHGLTAIDGIGEHIFKSDYIPDEKYWVKKGNIYTGEWETIYEMENEEGYRLDSNTPTPVEWEGKTYLAFHETQWNFINGVYDLNYFYNLYNVTDDSLAWKTDTIPVDFDGSGTPGVFPVFNEGQMLISNDAIYSYNLKDGRMKWKNYYGNSFTLTSRIEADNGKVYGNNGQGYFLCLDVHTGEEIFRTTTGGSPSRVEVHDGKCYLSAVTTYTHSQFMIIDANDGSVERTIRSPYEEEDKDAVYDFVLTVDKETGWAYTADYKNFLCFDFE